ncbi:hypothetical protein [Sporobacter termitidis]|uniref:hypothetical protein n=1 Tax=Sporobacter termitidis TaxID=44749 RepID=UPI001160DD90|nr:hypothetical protein [Sporobacter termitidis]
MINIKNVVIWALVLINVFFLVFFLWGIYSDRAEKTETLRSIGDLFAGSGVEIDLKGIREGAALQEYTVTRVLEDERTLAEALLGATARVDEGEIFTYTGDKGKAVFWSGGEFSFTFASGAYPAGGDAAGTAKKLLRVMNIDTAAAVTAEGEQGSETVTAVCAFGGQTVFNCRVRFSFRDGNLGEITGQHAAAVVPAADKADMSSPAAALISFLSAVKSGERPCTKISAVEPGYYIPASSSGNGSLRAAWRIVTDTGIFIVDAVTGKIDSSIE